MDLLRPDPGLGVAGLARRLPDERDLGSHGDGLEPQMDDLDRALVVPVGIEALVPPVEGFEEGPGRRARFPEGNVDLVRLAQVAAVERALQDEVGRGETVLGRVAPAPRLEDPELRLEAGQADLGVRLHERLRVILDRVRHQQAEGREDPGVAGDDDRRQAQVGGHLDGVHAAGPAEGEQGEGPGIDAPLDRNDPDGLFHVGVGDGHDPEGRRDGGFPDRAGQPRDGGPAPPGIDLHLPAQEELRVQAAEAEIGVGHGREVSLAVAGRSGVRAGALRTDAERAAPVRVGDRSAAGADRVDVDDGQPDGEFPDPALVGPADGPLDERDVGRGPAHVEADDVGEAGRPAEDPGSDDPPGRPGKGGPDRLDPGPGRRDVAFVRLHDPQLRPSDAAIELAEVAVHDGHEVGVDGRRRRPLELAVLGQEPARDGEEQPRLLELPGHDLLVRRVGVGVEETDGDGLGARAPDLPDDLPDLGRPDALLDVARGQRPLVQAEAALGRDELEPALGLEGVQVPAGLPADGQDVLEAGCGDQGDAAALPLEERVGGHGGAVDDEDGGGVLQDVADALEDGERRILRCREDLSVGEAAVPIDDEIGESPARIDPDADRGGLRTAFHGQRLI